MAEIARSKRKQALSLLLLAAILGLTAWFLLRDQELPALAALLTQIDGKFLLAAAGAMGLFFACEAGALRMLLGTLRDEIPLGRCGGYALIDFYFSSITPGCCGGQPSQIWYMWRDGIPVGVSSLCLLLFNLCYHISVLLIGGVSLCIGGGSLCNAMGNWSILVLYGAGAQAVLVVAFCAVVFSKRLVPAAAERTVRLLARLRVLRDQSAALEKVHAQVEEYQQGAQFIRTHPGTMAVLLGLTTVHLLALYSVPYWVYRAFSLSGNSFFAILAAQAVLTMATESLPLPGGAGVTETIFLLVHTGAFGELVVPAVLLCRGVNYYLPLLVGGAVAMRSVTRRRTKRKGAPLNAIKGGADAGG